jgi:outer membrane protein TolC
MTQPRTARAVQFILLSLPVALAAFTARLTLAETSWGAPAPAMPTPGASTAPESSPMPGASNSPSPSTAPSPGPSPWPWDIAPTWNLSAPTAVPSAIPSTGPSMAPSPSPIPSTLLVDEGEVLSLSTAIGRALTNNADVRDQHMSLRAAELSFEDAWDRMYLPTIALNLNSSGTKTVGHVPGKNTDLVGNSKDEHGYPTSSAELNLGSYTLYNFGRDKIAFDQSKLGWIRTQESFEESKRNVKFQVIIQFWTLKTALDKLDASNRSVEIAQAIVDLQESRLPLGKASSNDVSSSMIDLLNVKNLRDQNETSAKNYLWTFNILLGDPVGTKYKIEEEIKFLPIKVTEQILYDTYLKESPNMKSARKDLTNSTLNLELQEKNLLPLPLVKFSGVTVSYSNNYYGTKPDLYTQGSGNTNLDVSASVSMSVPLLGPGGLFGHRGIEQAQIQVDQQELHLRSTANRDLSQILQFVQNIRQYEVTVSNNRQSYKSSVSVLENALTSFSNGKSVSRLDLKDAINQARQSEIDLRDAILLHLNYKTQLAAFIGVDYLPRME